jgi:hypothetical protein
MHVIPKIPAIHLLTAAIIWSSNHLFFVLHSIGSNEAQKWCLVRVAFEDSISIYPSCTQDGQFLFQFYVCHPSNWQNNAINQWHWLQYHDIFDIMYPHSASETNLIQPSDTLASYAACHKLVPFIKWLNISHLDMHIHESFKSASIWGHKSHDCIAQEDCDHLKKHFAMFGNPIPPSDVPTYSIHIDHSAHDTVVVKAHCNALIFEASLQASESATDRLYPWQKVMVSPQQLLFLHHECPRLGPNNNWWTLNSWPLHSVGENVVLFHSICHFPRPWRLTPLGLQRQQLTRRQLSILFGPLKGLSPSWLLTRDQKRPFVTSAKGRKGSAKVVGMSFASSLDSPVGVR